jgi:hypothetical protein
MVDAVIASLKVTVTEGARLAPELLLGGVTELTVGGVVEIVGANTTSTQ